jgi:hypothetical protein
LICTSCAEALKREKGGGAMEKEKLLKKICKQMLITAWECGGIEARGRINHDKDMMKQLKRGKRSLPGDLTRALKRAGVLPL